MIEVFSALVELVVKAGLLVVYQNEPVLAFWHALELLWAAVRLARQVVKTWRKGQETQPSRACMGEPGPNRLTM